MTKTKRIFTPEERLSIFQEGLKSCYKHIDPAIRELQEENERLNAWIYNLPHKQYAARCIIFDQEDKRVISIEDFNI